MCNSKKFWKYQVTLKNFGSKEQIEAIASKPDVSQVRKYLPFYFVGCSLEKNVQRVHERFGEKIMGEEVITQHV